MYIFAISKNDKNIFLFSMLLCMTMKKVKRYEKI